MLQNRPHPNIPDGIWAQLTASLAELVAMLAALSKRTDVSTSDHITQSVPCCFKLNFTF